MKIQLLDELIKSMQSTKADQVKYIYMRLKKTQRNSFMRFH